MPYPKFEIDEACVRTVKTMLERGTDIESVKTFVENWGYPRPSDEALLTIKGYTTGQVLQARPEISPDSPPQEVQWEFAEKSPLQRHDQHLLWLASDWHVGKLVDPRDLGPVFAYNSTYFLDRLSTMVTEIAETQSFFQKAGIPAKNLYLDLNGDILDGSTMRPGQRIRVEFTVGDQIRLAKSAIVTSVERLSRFFERVIIIGKVGNHGRIGYHLDDDKTVDNHEMRLYDSLADCFRNNRKVTVVPGEQEYALYRVGNTVIQSEHGHRFKGGGATPITGAKKYVDEYRRSVVQTDADLYLFSHHHQPILHDFGQGRKIIMNGCLDGGDNYNCRVLAKVAGVSQWLLGIDAEHGLWYTRELLMGSSSRATVQPASFTEGAA